MENVLTFQQCIEQSSDTRHLILGNGFSMDIFPDIFNYRKLAEKITDPEIKALFEELVRGALTTTVTGRGRHQLLSLWRGE